MRTRLTLLHPAKQHERIYIANIFQIFASLTQQTFLQPSYWGYILLGILVFIEGPSATLAGAFIASTGQLSAEGVFIAAAVGNLTADISWYMLGFLGRFQRLARRVRLLQKHEAKITRLEQDMHQHAFKVLLLAKLSLSMSILALVAAGMARVSWRRWLPALLVGETIWTGALVVVGVYLGGQLQQLEQGLQIIAFTGLVIFVGFFLWWFSNRNKNKK